ncbi:S41 family peptidase [Dyadobacter crusticola]|uniref:S41 family peptidase n=1 Tax=Dyadobacter crusticola TaxID=292407 RepID=UPI00146FA62E|nr:S41 family peptidase [Dyadobacter crusticola]
MKKTLLLCFLAICLAGCEKEIQDNLSQNMWKGTLNAPGQNIALYFRFEKPFIGKLKCKVSIPQQQVFELPASECLIVGDSLYLEFSEGMKATYKARLGTSQVSGKWIQGNYTFPLTLERYAGSLFALYADQALVIAEKNALNTRNVDWAKLRHSVSKAAENAASVDQLVPALELILKDLKDKHGFIYYNNNSIGYETDTYKNVSPALRKAAYGNDKDIVSVQLHDSIAYLRIPASPDFQSGKEDAYNQQIQQHVCDLINKDVKHWIIDLRLNYGGSMFAMFGGLNKLLGDGKIGSFVNSNGEVSGNWIMKTGDFYVQQERRTSSGVRCKSRLNPGKIAVLTGPITASSGEAVAVAFKSLNNSKTIGEPTKGFTTALSGFAIGKDLTFFISTGYYSDAKGQVYRNGVKPDIEVQNGDDFKELLKDKKVTTAIEWMRN